MPRRQGLKIVSRTGTTTLYIRGRSAESAFLKALALTSPTSPRRPGARGKQNSIVLPFTAPDRA